MKTFQFLKAAIFALITACIIQACTPRAEKKESGDKSVGGRYDAELTTAPFVPAARRDGFPQKVLVKLEVP